MKYFARVPLTLTRVKGDVKPEVAQDEEFPKRSEYPAEVMKELLAQNLVYTDKNEDNAADDKGSAAS